MHVFWFNMFIYCKVIATITLAGTSILSQNYRFFFVVRTFNLYSLRNFPVYHTELLVTVTVLYLNSSMFVNLTAGVRMLWPISPHFPHQPSHRVAGSTLTFIIVYSVLNAYVCHYLNWDITMNWRARCYRHGGTQKWIWFLSLSSL